MSELLSDPDICGFRVETLINRPHAEVRQAIERTFHARHPYDLVLVYFSGHGVKDDTGRLHLTATDTVHDAVRATSVSSRFLLDCSEASAAAGQIIVLDCCFSGAYDAKAAGLIDLLAGEFRARQVTRGHYVITSSRGGEYSFQSRQPDGRVFGSALTVSLVEGIRTGRADIRDSGHISVEDAYRYAWAAVTERNRKQHPQFHMRSREGDSIVLARSPLGMRPDSEGVYGPLAGLAHPDVRARRRSVEALGVLLHDENAAKVALARQYLQPIAAANDDPLAPLAQRFLDDHETPQPRRRPSPRPRRPTPRPDPDPPESTARRDDGDTFPVIDPAHVEDDSPAASEPDDGFLLPSDPEFEGLVASTDPLGVFHRLPFDFQGPEPSNTVARWLFPTERYRAEQGRHWIDAVVAVAVAGLAAGRATLAHPVGLAFLPTEIGGAPVAMIERGILALLAVLALVRALSWPAWRISLTNRQVLIMSGVLWRRVSTISVGQITNIGMSQSPLGRLLGYGTLRLRTGSFRVHRVRRLANIDYLWLSLREERFEPQAAVARWDHRADDD
jgi:membrane protein YdbS with pleckstrin-like domain